MFNHVDSMGKMKYSESLEKEIDDARQKRDALDKQISALVRLWQETRKKEIRPEMDAANYSMGTKMKGGNFYYIDSRCEHRPYVSTTSYKQAPDRDDILVCLACGKERPMWSAIEQAKNRCS